MSLSNIFLEDIDEDPISSMFGSHMRQMSQIRNSLFPSDPFAGFGMLGMPMGGQIRSRMNLVPHRSPFDINSISNLGGINRLLNSASGSSSFTSSSSVFISNGTGMPQIYKEMSSVRSVNGVKETRRTIEDSTSGTRKMAIGHHADGRSRIIEKEQNINTGQREEREELINLDDNEAEEFEKEFQKRTEPHRFSINADRCHQLRIEEIGSEPLPAIQSVEDYHNRKVPSSRRAIRSSPLALPSNRTTNESSLLHSHPYSKPSTAGSSSATRKQIKKMKGHH